MTIDNFIRRLTSLGLAITLFIFIAAYSIIGTVLPQGLQREFYMESYPSMGSIITSLQFDQVYSSWIFRILLFLFIVNLSGCTLKILPGQLKRMNKDHFPKPGPDGDNLHVENMDLQIFRGILEKKKFRIVEDEKGFRASKHRVGNIGSLYLEALLETCLPRRVFSTCFQGMSRASPSTGFP